MQTLYNEGHFENCATTRTLILSLGRLCVIRPITEKLSEPDNLYKTKSCILYFILIRNNLLSVITLSCMPVVSKSYFKTQYYSQIGHVRPPVVSDHLLSDHDLYDKTLNFFLSLYTVNSLLTNTSVRRTPGVLATATTFWGMTVL